MTRDQLRLAVPALAFLAVIAASGASAQNLTPRTYWPTPKGSKILVLGYVYKTGDVVTDPSLPVTGVDSQIHLAAVAYQQTVSLFGRTTNLQVELPFVDGTTTGLLAGEAARRDVQGFGDLGLLVSINLLGAPAMDMAAFQELREAPPPILGFSVKIVAPTGEYDEDRLINIGTNRWAVKPRLGYIQPLGTRWLLEMAAGVWLIEDNDEFLGTTREQDPITAFDLSLIRRIRPGFWVSLDLNYYLGGRTTVGGVLSADLQRNSRVGLTVAYPIAGRHGIKASYSNGVVTESGGNFDKIGVSYIYLIP